MRMRKFASGRIALNVAPLTHRDKKVAQEHVVDGRLRLCGSATQSRRDFFRQRLRQKADVVLLRARRGDFSVGQRTRRLHDEPGAFAGGDPPVDAFTQAGAKVGAVVVA